MLLSEVIFAVILGFEFKEYAHYKDYMSSDTIKEDQLRKWIDDGWIITSLIFVYTGLQMICGLIWIITCIVNIAK
jgi:hypothetical protein